MRFNKNLWVAGCMIFLFATAVCSTAYAQTDLIDNIKIETIKKIDVVDKNVLQVTVGIRNSNNKTVQIRKGTFVFKFGAIQKDAIAVNGTTITNAAILIGNEEGFQSTEMVPADTILQGTSSQVFDIQMGDDAQALTILKHIMNCIGFPEMQKPYLTVEGSFELGIKSEKGWTTGRDLGIEWVFIPRTPKEVDLYTAQKKDD